MIHPAPTSKIDPTLCRGVLERVMPETKGVPAQIVMSIANSSAEMLLRPMRGVRAEVGKRIIGRITLRARRVDVVDTGGKYVEPLVGHPRRVQGRVIGVDESRRAIIVDAGVPMHCELTDMRQTPSGFAVGELVSFDAMDGAVFEEI